MELSTVTYYLIISVTLIYFFSKYKFSYWSKKKVLYPEPTFPYGNLKQTLKENVPFSSIISQSYDKAKSKGHKFFGVYKFWIPSFVPVDLDLIKLILHKDFTYFTDRGVFVDEENDPLTGNLFNLQEHKWRNMRQKLTPTFTSGKMKMMFQTMVVCTKHLDEILKEYASINEPVEFKDLLARFTTDIIGNVGFGIEINSMKDPDSEFRKEGIKAFEFSISAKIKLFLIMVLPPWLLKKFNISFHSAKSINFFINLVEKTVAYREKNNVFRKDFIHLMIQLKNFGRVTDLDESTLMNKEKPSVEGITINEMAAQAFVFFLAGFETSATTMTFALIELGQNMDIQEKVREEIKRIIEKYNNEITYDGIMEMEYLEKVVSETLRKHPPLPLIPRTCTKDYNIPGTDVVIESGTTVEIPTLSIQRDPEYYPDPDKFDPERFNAENKANRHPYAYIPFGEGPRICIGVRLGKLQVKVGLCSILSKYRITINKKTALPIKYNPGLISTVKGGVYLNLESV
ncbi:unnamed protein product [Psylliodes chrysocephalus]|uniref:Cytochrome P450 n=1 Tax=Psylliodes chrysocephalus TaxID=3402493 RepID=A0A9P0CP50_9CUCU|nr:unnamed protein product [Psylliodes chrysocephala]